MINFDFRKNQYVTIIVAIVIAFVVGLYIGKGDSKIIGGPVDTSVVTTEQFETFWKAWSILNEKYVESASTTVQDKIWGSIQGLASSYKDPYTVFFPPVDAKMFKDEISGNFEGVGMEIGIKNNQLQVVTPIKNSPAEKAGVKAGDLILKIDDKNTSDMPVDAAVKLIRGPKGSKVTITFFSPSTKKPVERTIIRDIIDVPTLDTSTVGSDIFVIKLYSFTSQSPYLFRTALRDFVSSGKNKLILDLRGNPGGYLDAAWDISSWFLPSGKTVVTEDFGKNGSPRVYRSKGYDVFNDNLKMLILVDEGSASASEILAGALKENGVAKLVGSKTFGKGSVQELVELTPDTSLKITIARWLTPQGHNLSHDGLVPDYPIKPTDKDIEAKKDVVMDKAVEILKNMK